MRALAALWVLAVALPAAAAPADSVGRAAGASSGPTLALPEAGRAPDFSVRSVTNQQLVLADLRRKGPVVVDFWATWCKPCLQALPELEKLSQRYQDLGLTVVGISTDGPRNYAKVRPSAAKLGLHFPVAIDKDENLQQLYHVKGVPTTFLIAPDGRIAWYRLGYLPGDGDDLARAVAKLFEAPEPKTEP